MFDDMPNFCGFSLSHTGEGGGGGDTLLRNQAMMKVTDLSDHRENPKLLEFSHKTTAASALSNH